jgi:hypothetical protein
MQVGYARASTSDQEAGVLTAAGCEKVFSEQVSSVAQRPQLEAAVDYLRDGDVLVITKLDRLARSVAHLVAIGEQLEAKGVALKVLDQAIDTSTPTGRLMFNMLGSIAQFERELMLERQREYGSPQTRTGRRLLAMNCGGESTARDRRRSLYRWLSRPNLSSQPSLAVAEAVRSRSLRVYFPQSP